MRCELFYTPSFTFLKLLGDKPSYMVNDERFDNLEEARQAYIDNIREEINLMVSPEVVKGRG